MAEITNQKSMRANYIAPDDLQALEIHLNKIEIDKDIKSLLFLMAYGERYSEKLLIPLLQRTTKPIIGGVFPELIFMGERKKSGVLLLPLPFELNTQLFDLSETPQDFLEQLESGQKDSLDPLNALFVFIDALGSNKEPFIESLFNFFGINPTYIGGGAGSLKFEPFSCIISNTGMYANAAVIGWANKKIALGVAHGWHSVSAPLKVTKSNKNQLLSINWKPAFEVYKEIVEMHSGMKFTANNFFNIAKSYPLGISKIDAEMVVRDPFAVIDNVLHLVDNINEGEYVEILHGNLDSLLAGASKAREIASSKIEDGMDINSVFCIDCISRVLFMENDFIKELEAIGHNANVTGILTIGELANSGESFLEIYNKTIVIGLW
jgi:hypothetical protein